MGKKTKKDVVESPGYTVGALSQLISGNDDLPFKSLFATSNKQKEASLPCPLTGSTNKKNHDVMTNEEVKDDDEVLEGEPQPVTPSLKRKAQLEDAKEFEMDPEKEKRTLFIGNLCIKAKKKDLYRLFKPFGSIECVRFRGAARPDPKTLKKVTVIRKLHHESRDNFLAYIRFKTPEEAESATKLNGTVYNDKTLRIDIALKDKVDQKKAVFVGNLDFSVNEEELRSHFLVCGAVSNIRLVRDKSTGIGKGFGFINFMDSDGVLNALELNHTELKGRKIRVMRSSNRPKTLVNRKMTKNSAMTGSKSKPKVKSFSLYKKVNKNNDTKSFQGVSVTSDEKVTKKRKTKLEKKNTLIAKKLINHKSTN
ncbi:RNA-binding protein 34 [Lepeophtheirus salmonis]|uniref:RNA-binding protein 34 n=1 Tax=Lepeophtheirus salmonis TaxID=72036 RepID=UPI001AE5D186|nr:RNA-binding protein 34-like [Lepeophtheirus salmonis]